MAAPAVLLGLSAPGCSRDRFLGEALRRGAAEALWADLDRGWVERYSAPRAGAGRGGRRFTRRELLWPGDVVGVPDA